MIARAASEALRAFSPYRMSMLALAIAILGWTVPFAIEGDKFDQFSQSLNVRLDSMRARLNGMKTGIDGGEGAKSQRPID
jgi:hypothetical protein